MDTGKKTSKLTFEDKKKPPSKVSQGVKEAPIHLVAGKRHKEIRETEGLFCYKSGRYSQSPQGRKSRRNPRNVHDLTLR